MHRRPSLVSTTVALCALIVAACGDDVSSTAEDDTSSNGAESSSTTTITSSSTTITLSSTTITSTSTSTTTTTTTTTTLAPVVIQSDVEATYTPVDAPPGAILVHDRFTVSVVDLTADPVEPQILLGPIDGLLIEAARMASDGSLVVELYEDVPIGEPVTVRKIVQFSPNGSIVDLIEGATLYDVARFGGVEQALVGELWDGDVDDEGQLVAVPLDGRPPVGFGTAFAPEYGVGSIDVHDEVAMVSAFADLTELVSYTDADGNGIIRPSPTDGIPYGMEPFVLLATFSPDGSEVAWVEGPEHYIGPNSAGEPAWFGEWRIRTFDAATGEEGISWPFDFPTPDPFLQLVTGLTHTGDHIVVSRGQVHDGLVFELELSVLDLTGEEPELYDIPVAGTAHAIADHTII